MTSRFTPVDDQRSQLMRKVRRSGTDIELRVARSLRELGVRYRKNSRFLPGSPDFSNQSQGWALFVHGCFWHGHAPCELAKLPRHNRAAWAEKLEGNRERDARKSQALRALGLKVGTVWQCELANDAKLRRRLRRLVGMEHIRRETVR